MIFRLILGLALVVLAGGFIWFAAQVIWLGTKEFFKIRNKQARNKTKQVSNDIHD